VRGHTYYMYPDQSRRNGGHGAPATSMRTSGGGWPPTWVTIVLSPCSIWPRMVHVPYIVRLSSRLPIAPRGRSAEPGEKGGCGSTSFV
jgi:hypothetical protein